MFDDLPAMSIEDHDAVCDGRIGQSAWRYVNCPVCGEQVDQFGANVLYTHEKQVATMSDDAASITVGSVWHRIGMKERVRIGRVWRGAFTGYDNEWVRCHPLHGGATWCAPVEEFLKRYEQEG